MVKILKDEMTRRVVGATIQDANKSLEEVIRVVHGAAGAAEEEWASLILVALQKWVFDFGLSSIESICGQRCALRYESKMKYKDPVALLVKAYEDITGCSPPVVGTNNVRIPIWQLWTLCPGEWLESDVIWTYLSLLVEARPFFQITNAAESQCRYPCSSNAAGGWKTYVRMTKVESRS